VIAFLGFIAYLLESKFDVFTLWSELSVQDIEKKYLFLIVTLLLIVPNWSLEAQKWKIVMKEYLDLSFVFSLKSVFAGITIGLLTPAKLGEYAGRMIFLGEEDRAASAVSTLLSSMAQMVATLFFGTISLLGLVYKLEVINLNVTEIIGGVALILILIVVAFSFLPEIISVLSKSNFLSKYLVKVKELRVPRRVLLIILSLAVLRYSVYAFQYLFVIYFLGVEHCFVELLGYISIVFLLQTLLPLPPLASLIGRGGIAIMIFSTIGINELVILCATLLLWVINLVLPALCGLTLVMKHRTQVTT